MSFLEIKDVKKSFKSPSGAPVEVLHGVDLSVEAGSAVAVLGPSGSGKSTLLSMMAGLEKPDSGEVWVDGSPIHSLGEEELAKFRAKKMGIIFQSFYLHHALNALQNVKLAAELSGVNQPKQKAKEALDKVGLGHRLTHKPSELSGGEQQRVCIARVLVTQAKFILCDEPTGSLDPENADIILDLLFKLQSEMGATLIFITHDHAIAQRLGKTISIERGKVKTVNYIDEAS